MVVKPTKHSVFYMCKVQQGTNGDGPLPWTLAVFFPVQWHCMSSQLSRIHLLCSHLEFWLGRTLLSKEETLFSGVPLILMVNYNSPTIQVILLINGQLTLVSIGAYLHATQDRIVLSMEQELLRAHQRASKSPNAVSVCSLLLEQLLPKNSYEQSGESTDHGGGSVQAMDSKAMRYVCICVCVVIVWDSPMFADFGWAWSGRVS